MPLQNRVDPFGDLFAASARGTLFGNRGGKFHRDDKTLPPRRHASRQWICCVLTFKERQRDVWGKYYTELFFLDEPTAFAAGHRPCFECRRADAINFANKFSDHGKGLSAPEMDAILHRERLDGRSKRLHRVRLDDLSDGAFISVPNEGAFAVKGAKLLRWTPSGYSDAQALPKHIDADMLTPPSIARVLSRGYRPRWHESAER